MKLVKFEDLKFKPWHVDSVHAVKNFKNGYGVSVVFGENFYSNGVDTYELAVLKDGELDYDNEVSDGDVRGYLKKDELMKLINQVKSFNINS